MTVPNVLQLTVINANKILEQAGLKNQIDYPGNSVAQGPMLIVNQSPHAATKVQRGTLIKLTACPNGKCK